MSAPVEMDFEQRLLRFLLLEEHDERRQHHDLRAMPVDQRVLEGECIAAARVVPGQTSAERLVLQVEENLSKFRQGDAVTLSDGRNLAFGSAWVYGGYDDRTRLLSLERDRYGDPSSRVDEGGVYCVDRRAIGARGRLRDVVRAGFADPRVRALLEGRLPPAADAERIARARVRLAERGLNPAQVEAGAQAVGTDGVGLVQGPPGTGKTRLLGEILALLCGAKCRIALSAFTHKAVDHALLTVRRLSPRLPVFKLSDRDEPELAAQGVRILSPKRAQYLPKEAALVGGTAFALARLPDGERFHFTVFDEAGQLPIPHAIAGLNLAQRWMFFGDHKQLPPVISARHADTEAAASIFEHLTRTYPCPVLDVTYRMNERVCAVVSTLFYDGILRPEPSVGARRLAFVPGGRFDAVLDPEHPVILARVDHLQPGMRSLAEANLVADLLEELVRRHGVPPAEIAVIAPFRAQVRVIRSALQRKGLAGTEAVTIDTVERIQGQEREVIVLSLAVGDPDALERRGTFFLSTNRLNVALSRARVKAIVVGSRSTFEALPGDVEGLRAAAAFRRLYRMLPQVDLTAVYAQ
ncbi:MAG: ATP-binding protein [Planctomycetota bacterium]